MSVSASVSPWDGSVEVYTIYILILIPLLKGKFSVPPHYFSPMYIGEI